MKNLILFSFLKLIINYIVILLFLILIKFISNSDEVKIYTITLLLILLPSVTTLGAYFSYYINNYGKWFLISNKKQTKILFIASLINLLLITIFAFLFNLNDLEYFFELIQSIYIFYFLGVFMYQLVIKFNGMYRVYVFSIFLILLIFYFNSSLPNLLNSQNFIIVISFKLFILIILGLSTYLLKKTKIKCL